MKKLLFICSIAFAIRARAQVSIGSDGISLLAGTTLSAEGLVLVPQSNLSLTNNTIQKSATPVNIGGSVYSIANVVYFSAPLSFTGIVHLNYKESELNGNAESQLLMAYQSSSAWATSSTSAVNTTDNYVEETVSSKNFDGVTASVVYVSLPVSLTSYTAKRQANASVLLNWKTGGTEGFYYNSGTSASPNWVQLLAGNYVQLAPSTQQTSASTNALINLKLVGTTGLGVAGVNSLVSLSASGTYTDGNTHDKERFRIDNDGSILAVSDYNGGVTSTGVPMEGSGTRFLWYAQKAAFRAGSIDGTQWDDANIGLYSTALGENVRALGDNAIAFGKSTVAAGSRTIAFGEGCTATGANSVALGYGSSTSTSAGSPRQGSFVFADRSVPLVYNFGSNIDASSQFHPTVNHSFNVRATGGSYFYTNTALTTGLIFKTTDASLVCANNALKLNNDGSTTITSDMYGNAGVSLAAGGGSWASLSDVNMKENFANVDGEELLERLRMVPITSWNYKTQDSKVRHIGPMAQDFAAAFNVGEDNRHIATIDPDGVALAGVQALDNRTNTQQQRIEDLQKENKALKERLDRLEKLLLEQK